MSAGLPGRLVASFRPLAPFHGSSIAGDHLAPPPEESAARPGHPARSTRAFSRPGSIPEGLFQIRVFDIIRRRLTRQPLLPGLTHGRPFLRFSSRPSDFAEPLRL